MDYVITAIIALIVGALGGLFAGYKWGQAAINKVMAEAAKLTPPSSSPPPHV